MANKFVVSVADVILRDPTTLETILYGKANIDSALTMSMTATDVRGGINNPLLYTYFHDKKVDVKITSAIFNQTIIALNAGASVLNNTVNVMQTDCIVLSSGSGTLTKTPAGSVDVQFSNDTFSVITPTGSSIYVPTGANQKVTAIYATSMAVDEVIVAATTPPTVTDLTMIAEVRDNTGVIVYYLQINIPRFQISGNYNLSLAANGVSNQPLEGTALVTSSADCSSGDYYAKFRWLPVSATAVGVSDIAVTPTTWSFTPTGTTSQTKQLTTYGLRGGLYTPMNITTSASYNVTSGSTGLAAYYNVGLHTGTVVAGSSVASGWLATIKSTYIDSTTSACCVDYCYITAL